MVINYNKVQRVNKKIGKEPETRTRDKECDELLA
jgi:hypothetical protein